jgi:hypothetical protein
MNRIKIFLVITVMIFTTSCRSEKNEWIRINQIGYRTNDIKVAVFISRKPISLRSFKVIDVISGFHLLHSKRAEFIEL